MSDAAEVVAARAAQLIDRIPAALAVHFGRISADEDPDAPNPFRTLRRGGDPLRYLAIPAERLLGALELTLGTWEPVTIPWEPPPHGDGLVAIATVGSDSTVVSATDLLVAIHPYLPDVVESLAREALRPDPAPATDEAGIAAHHGASYLAVSVAAAAVILDQIEKPDPGAIVGLGVTTAVRLLTAAPLPAGYDDAHLARIRAEYRPPPQLSAMADVTDSRFGLLESGIPEAATYPNGLVSPVTSGLVIRTGVATGKVRVEMSVRDAEPPDVEPGWEEVVDVSWHALHGSASTGAQPHWTPPWPGDYRVRVHARGRDENDAEYERYRLVLWPGDAAPDVVHRRTDRLGHRLRGEPEPPPAPRPELAYRWIRRSVLASAATVTVVTGTTADAVLRAFGAGEPEDADDFRDSMEWIQWVAVLDAGGSTVLAIEDNGFRGSDLAVLAAASAGGRAASMYWSVEADARLTFAEEGRVLAQLELMRPFPAVLPALAGLDFTDHVDRIEKGLVAVERFTGRGITAADVDRIEVGYPV